MDGHMYLHTYIQHAPTPRNNAKLEHREKIVGNSIKKRLTNTHWVLFYLVAAGGSFPGLFLLVTITICSRRRLVFDRSQTNTSHCVALGGGAVRKCKLPAVQ